MFIGTAQCQPLTASSVSLNDVRAATAKLLESRRCRRAVPPGVERFQPWPDEQSKADSRSSAKFPVEQEAMLGQCVFPS